MYLRRSGIARVTIYDLGQMVHESLRDAKTLSNDFVFLLYWVWFGELLFI